MRDGGRDGPKEGWCWRKLRWKTKKRGSEEKEGLRLDRQMEGERG